MALAIGSVQCIQKCSPNNNDKYLHHEIDEYISDFSSFNFRCETEIFQC